MQMSGFPKVEMSAWAPQWRHGDDRGADDGGTGPPADPDPAGGAAADAAPGPGAARTERAPRAAPPPRAGAAAVASRRRGHPSNRRLAPAVRARALALVRARYADFGPTFAHQKLTEDHGLVLSVETLRGWLITAGLWLPRAQRARRSYPPRPRRACRGELVQIDGSEHAWCEDRGPVCTLLVYVDD